MRQILLTTMLICSAITVRAAEPVTFGTAPMYHPNAQRVIVSPDGKTAATINAAAVRFWRIADGSLTASWEQGFGFEPVVFTADGRSLLTGHADGTASLRSWLPAVERGVPCSDKELERLWADLASEEFGPAAAAMRRLASVPDQAVSMIARRFADVGLTEGNIGEQIRAIDSDDSKQRAAAMRNLRAIGPAALPKIREARDDVASPKVAFQLHMLEMDLESLPESRYLRPPRVGQVLRWIGTPEAHEVLAKTGL